MSIASYLLCYKSVAAIEAIGISLLRSAMSICFKILVFICHFGLIHQGIAKTLTNHS